MKRNPSRLLPVTAAAILTFAACGSDDTAGETTLPSADASSGDAVLAPRPIELASGSASGGASAEVASADSRMATDMAMPYQITTFVAGEGLPALPTNDLGYVYQPGASIDADRVAALAAGLGVTGTPELNDDDPTYQWWTVGPDDGTAPMLTVSQDAQLGWSYSMAWATAPMRGGCAIAEPAVAVVEGDAASGDVAVAPSPDPVAPDCVEPEPPVGVPTMAEAEQLTRDLMAAIGTDSAAYELQSEMSYADQWSASVALMERIDGIGTGRTVYAAYGGDAVLQYASGSLAEPQLVGPYPLIDLDTSIARLNDQNSFYGGGFGVRGGPAAMDVAVASVEAVSEPSTGVVVGETAVAPPAGEPGVVEGSEGTGGGEPGVAPVETADTIVPSVPPVEPLPVEPTEVTVTLVDVQADVWWAWDVDGSVWLLPAYRFIGEDGGWYTVPAVTDEFLIQPVVDVLPMPEPLPVETNPGEPTPEPLPVDPALFDATQLEPSVGSSLADFTAVAEGLGASVRVVMQDGEALAVTEDFSPTRVNVAVEGDVVTSIQFVG